MCGIEPASGLALGATVLSTGLGIADRVASRSAAIDNRAMAMNTVLNQTIPSIYKSLGNVYNSNEARTIQTNDAAATQKFDILRGMAEAKGTATAQAADGGVGGVSFANILSDFETREALAKGNIDYNAKTGMQQVADENDAAKMKAEGQANQALNGAVASTPIPSQMSTVFGAGADLAKGALRIADMKGLFATDTKIDPTTGATIPKTK